MQLESITLIITTYNWPTALDLVLTSVLAQSILPSEVIIADDGSQKATRNLVSRYQRTFPVPLIHSWQEDNGFRLARSRNRAIAKASGEYIILIDGDMVLHSQFIHDHRRAAKRARFVQGRRAILTSHLSQKLLRHSDNREQISLFSTDVKNKLNALHNPLLSPLVSSLLSKQSCYSVRGCNMAIWRSDLVKINGFNENFTGWGREDSELALRLLNSGVQRYDLRLAGIAYHLHHPPESSDSMVKNEQLLEEAIAQNTCYCSQGLKDHLE